MSKPKRHRVERTKAGGYWTKAQYFSFLRGTLRRAVQRYPVKTQVKIGARKIVTGQRHRYEYECANCKCWSTDKHVEVDHIEPAGSLKEYDDLPAFVERLFCEPEGLQVLCKPCHKAKTKREGEARKLARVEAKHAKRRKK